MKNVAIVGAGGTIAMQGAHPFDWIDYGDTGVINPVERIVAGMDLGLADIRITTHPFRMLASTGMTVQDWLDLRHVIETLAADGAHDGIVVTHGTATLEETAFFLKLTVDAKLAVVLCGAQRPPNTTSSDAAANLRQAVIAAAAAPAGVYVAMNGHLFDPADVTKTANQALDAFEAPEFGPLGRMEADGSLSMRRCTVASTPLFRKIPQRIAFPRVDICYSYSGADGVAIGAFVAAGARAIVSVGFAPGRSTPGERAALLRAVDAGVTVIQSSRAPRGAVPVQPYNVAAGILAGGELSPVKIRIVALLALAIDLGKADLQRLLMGGC